MSAAAQPYVVLALVVLAVAAWKGFLPIPGFSRLPKPIQDDIKKGADAAMPAIVSAADPLLPGLVRPVVEDLAKLDPHTLGLAFAASKRTEAERELAARLVADAGDAIKATFVAPFSPPGGTPPAAPGGGQ